MSNDRLLEAVDLSALPAHLEGQWVLLRLDSKGQEIVSSGENVLDVVRGQPDGPNYVLTRVPHRYTVHVVHAAI